MNDADKRIAADLLFKRLLLKPDDLDAGFQYAQLETELGDYEAAIGALERILYYNPNLPRVKLQLGVLYFHLRSYEMARNYLDAVINASDGGQWIGYVFGSGLISAPPIGAGPRLLHRLERELWAVCLP